jgi:hypothetical protein
VLLLPVAAAWRWMRGNDIPSNLTAFAANAIPTTMPMLRMHNVRNHTTHDLTSTLTRYHPAYYRRLKLEPPSCQTAEVPFLNVQASLS